MNSTFHPMMTNLQPDQPEKRGTVEKLTEGRGFVVRREDSAEEKQRDNKRRITST